jgi:hypothetical protein
VSIALSGTGQSELAQATNVSMHGVGSLFVVMLYSYGHPLLERATGINKEWQLDACYFGLPGLGAWFGADVLSCGPF